jgi:hypothetical protein
LHDTVDIQYVKGKRRYEMKSKVISKFFIVVGLLALALSTMAFTPASSVNVAGGGTGTLDAFGTGTAGIIGGGTVKVTGNGVLWVKDNGGDAKVTAAGYGRVLKTSSGWTRYEGFNGSAKVQGSNIEVKIVGANVVLHAEGTGKFYLAGKGTYKTGTTSGNWSTKMKTYEIK